MKCSSLYQFLIVKHEEIKSRRKFSVKNYLISFLWKFKINDRFNLSFLSRSWSFEIAPLVSYAVCIVLFGYTIRNSNFLIRDALLDIFQGIALQQRMFFSFETLSKICQGKSFLTLYFPDSVFIRENTGQRKPAFLRILRSKLRKEVLY